MKQKLHYIYIWFDYSMLLPFLAFLPQKTGRYLAKLRGILYFYKKRDWRSFTFKDYELFNRTYQAYQEMFPELDHESLLNLVKQRYISQSIEEFESALIVQKKYHTIGVKYVGMEKVQEYLQKEKKAIFTTGHFGSIVGLTYLHIFKNPTLHMASNVTKQKIVHPSITNFYIKKYLVGNDYMNGGEVLDVEGNNRKFFSFLKKNGSLSTIADLPANPQNEVPLWKEFFGKTRGFATGLQRLSNATNTKIIPYVCYYENGTYIMKFGSLDEDIYKFLENEIRMKPHLWWAADLLPTYTTK